MASVERSPAGAVPVPLLASAQPLSSLPMCIHCHCCNKTLLSLSEQAGDKLVICEYKALLDWLSPFSDWVKIKEKLSMKLTWGLFYKPFQNMDQQHGFYFWTWVRVSLLLRERWRQIPAWILWLTSCSLWILLGCSLLPSLWPGINLNCKLRSLHY